MPSDKIVEVGPKLYLNGFPKSGTHLLESMAVNIIQQADEDGNWMGNVDKNGFGTSLINMDSYPKLLADMPMRRFVKGHTGWTAELAKAFYDNRWCMAFIYRDLRDVAVSTVYHALSDHETTNFPHKEYYKDMEFGEILKRVITGDENIDGLLDRWELFAPWLEEDWVLKLDFGGVIHNKELAAEVFIRYIFGRTGQYYGGTPTISADAFNRMMHLVMYRLDHPDKSPTYRKGKTGGWKEHFTDEHKALFKASDKNNWLIRLGYENDRKW